MSILVILIFFVPNVIFAPILPLYKAPYQARPKIQYLELIQTPNRFKHMTNFKIDVFYNILLIPLN